MTTIGIDPSINSTGICILKNKQKPIYFIIASTDKYKSKKSTEFINSFSHDRLYVFLYNKEKVEKSASYAEKERVKTQNVSYIVNIINNIIKDYQFDQASMEGISYGSVGSQAIADLAGLNFAIRMLLNQHNIPFTIFSPTEVKKNAVGNGGAIKEEMVYAWKACDPDIYKDISNTPIVSDDIADAYFIAKMA